MPLLNLVRNTLLHFAVISLIFQQFLFVSSAAAANLPINPDGTTNTHIDAAANGVPIVNIAAANSGGLSHNKFTDYNVNQQGLILNNATGNVNGVVRTQIGGLITDNVNLKHSGAASIILNEVTSNRVTRLNGYTEIAGKRADLIIANPNGISMSGAGFINTARLTAVVGSSDQHNPHPENLSFSLSQDSHIESGFLPKLTISGTGVDLKTVDSTDLVASLMNIVAPIYAENNEVNLRAGDKAFNYNSKIVTSDNTTPGSGTPEELAIDASALAKIQAGKIYIIATKEGFGIKFSGDLLASRAGIEIDAAGNIQYKNIESNIDESNINENSGKITLTSHKGSLTQGDESIIIAKNLTINSSQSSFVHKGGASIIADFVTLNSDFDITFQTNSLISSKNSSDSSLTLKVNTPNNFNNYGNIISQKDLTLTSSNLIHNYGDIVANGSLYVTASNDIENYATLSAKTDLSITSDNGNINNSNYAREVSNFVASLSDLDDSTSKFTDYVNAEELALLNTLLTDPNHNLTLEQSNSLLLKVKAFVVSKQIAGNNILPANINIKSDWALLHALKDHINGNQAYYKVSLLSDSVTNRKTAEIIGGTGKTTLKALNGKINQNSLHSLVVNGDLTLDVDDFVNTGRVDIAGDFTLNVAGDLTNAAYALIYSGGDMTLNVVNNITNNSGAVIYSEG
mgnify:CR=1 FL=1